MIKTPECWTRKCTHLIGVDQPDGTEATERIICKAFPKGIPAEIVDGDDKHETKHEKQVGNFVYEKQK